MEFDYRFEALTEALSVCVTQQHKFGTDAFLLADFARPRRKDTACDLGSGCGIVPMLWFRHDAPKAVYAVEIQQQAVWQMNKTLQKNNLEGRFFPLQADLKELKSILPRATFDLVTCNPPYKVANTGILSKLPCQQIARHEVLCTIADVCAAAASLLRFGGRLCLCQRPERLLDTLLAMRQSGLEPKRLRFVQQRPETAPWLFLVEGKKGAKPFLQVEKPLFIAGDGRDGFSAELLKIYGGDKV